MASAPVPARRRARRSGAGAVVLSCLILVLAACGGSGSGSREAASTPATTPAGSAHPAGDPSAHVRAPATRAKAKAKPARKRKRETATVPDPVTAGATPKTSQIAQGAPSDEEVKRELAQAYGYTGADKTSTRALVDRALLSPDGLVTAPVGAPKAVQAMINGANTVAHLPYVYGGGHGGHWEDSAYDCSGSVSFALASAGFLKSQLDSTALARWGKPGPGRWVTIYANKTHAFMVVAGVRFDTSGRSGRLGSRWQGGLRSTRGFTVRHPKGL